VKNLLLDVHKLAEQEYDRAADKFGPTNNSPHESYSVILEEFEEAQEDSERFNECLALFWKCIKSNVYKNPMLSTMQEIAEHAAAEWVQVAAMCYKAMVEKEKKP